MLLQKGAVAGVLSRWVGHSPCPLPCRRPCWEPPDWRGCPELCLRSTLWSYPDVGSVVHHCCLHCLHNPQTSTSVHTCMHADTPLTHACRHATHTCMHADMPLTHTCMQTRHSHMHACRHVTHTCMQTRHSHFRVSTKVYVLHFLVTRAAKQTRSKYVQFTVHGKQTCQFYA